MPPYYLKEDHESPPGTYVVHEQSCKLLSHDFTQQIGEAADCAQALKMAKAKYPSWDETISPCRACCQLKV